MIWHRVMPLLLPLALLLSCAARAAAPPNPYTVDQIERLLRGGVHPEKILADARRECIAFRILPDVAAQLVRAGASRAFVQHLAAVCYYTMATR
jgi:hypothetical protein